MGRRTGAMHHPWSCLGGGQRHWGALARRAAVCQRRAAPCVTRTQPDACLKGFKNRATRRATTMWMCHGMKALQATIPSETTQTQGTGYCPSCAPVACVAPPIGGWPAAGFDGQEIGPRREPTPLPHSNHQISCCRGGDTALPQLALCPRPAKPRARSRALPSAADFI